MTGSIIGLTKNELVKIYHKKRLLLSIIILIITSVWILAGSVNSIDSKRKELERAKNSTTMQFKSIEEISKKAQKDIDDYEKAKEWSMDEIKNSYKDDIKALEEKKGDPATDLIIDNDISYLKYLSDNDLRPTTTMDLDSNGILKRAITAISLVSTLIILLISCDAISDEFNIGTMKLLITKPFSRTKIVISKFLANTIICTALIFAFEIALYIIGVLMKGYTSLSYPEQVYPRFQSGNILNPSVNVYMQPVAGTGGIIPSWELFLRAFMLQILFIACIVGVCILFSSFIRNNAVVTLTMLSITFLSLLSSIYKGLNFYSYLLFANYYDFINLIDGIIPMQTGSYYVNNVEIVIILLLYTSISLFISTRILNKKDIL